MSEIIYRNTIAATDTPLMSVVTPFFRNDPSLLLSILADQARGLRVELIVVDDGSGLADLTDAVRSLVDQFPCPAQLITFTANKGRSAARNRLIEAATAPYLLFLDSDMAPDQPTYLADWLAFIERTMPVIAYGGYSTLQVPVTRDNRLARELAEHMDCRSAGERAERGALAVATSNLLVRADVMKIVPFDAGFQGWGWEDVDWALRACEAGYAVSHVDIVATHMGLDSPEVLLDKFAKAGPNFKRVMDRHPRMQALPGTRAARVLSRFPVITGLLPLFRQVAMTQALPMKLRTRAARLWRAGWAAKAL
jgi:glycosyltransferase involved in cell wall biosynthesis